MTNQGEYLSRRGAAYAEPAPGWFRELVEGIDAGVFECDGRTLRFRYVSPRVESMLGWPSARWLAEDDFWADVVVHPDDREGVLAEVRRQLAAGRDHELEYRARCADGSVLWVRDLIRLELDAEGCPVTIRGLLLDVSRQKAVEEALREAEERLRLAVEGSPISLYENDHELRYTWIANPVGGFSGAELVGRRDDELLAPEHAAALMAVKWRALATGRAERALVDGALGGSPHSADLYVEPVPDGTGGVRGVRVASTDVTALRMAQRELTAATERLDGILAATEIGTWRIDVRDDRMVPDRNLPRLFGLEAVAEQRPLTTSDFVQRVHADHRRRVVAGILELAEQGGIFEEEYPVRLPDGSDRWLLARGRVELDESGRPITFTGVAIDVTHRHATEQALRDSEERFRTLADNISQFAWMADPDGSVFWYNRRWYEYTGTTLAEVEGWGWTRCHHPDHVDRVVERLQRSWDTGESWEDIFPLQAADGSYRWFLSRAQPIRDEQGRIQRWFGTNTDITEQREAELELARSRDDLERRVERRTAELQRRAEQLSRLSSELTLAERRERQRLARILHDDLQQLLVGTRIGVEMLEPAGDADREAHRRILSGLDQALQSARTLTVELSPPILDEGGLAAGLEWLARHMREKHALDVDLALDPRGNPEREDIRTLVFESVRELLLNVVKHTDETGARVELAPEGDDAFVVRVIDRGPGFDRDVALGLEQGDRDGGWGLLSIRERLTLLDGSFDVRTAPGAGACFTLRATRRSTAAPPADLPELEAPSAPRPPLVAEESTGERLRVLVVDDHVVVREGMLALLGAQDDIEVVGEAGDGIEAVELAHRLLPDVVLMDFSMPRLDGVAATRRIRSALPGVGVIGLSMYDAADRGQAMLDAGAAAYCSKTGDTEELLRVLRWVGT